MTYRREFVKRAGLGLVATAVAPSLWAQAQETASKRPNILLILVDDMGWSDIGCYGGEVDIPNIDALANRGVRFTQFHNTAKCFPSRACLLTGLYAQQCGMSESPGTLQNCTTLGEVMRTAGYRTLTTGKHHGLDNPFDRGFDRYYGLRDGACNHFNPGEQRPGEGAPAHKNRPPPRTWCIDDQVISPFTPTERDFYSTDYFTKYALGYLDEYAHEDKPFFMYLSYTAPHDPLMACPEDIEKGSCTPLIASWPDGIKGENRISHDVGHFIDFMPTIAEIAGATYPSEFARSPIPPMQGQSLLSILKGDTYTRQGPIYWNWRDGKAVRHENYRLVSDKGDPWELYDMRVDRTETDNLAERNPDTVTELNALYQSWAKT